MADETIAAGQASTETATTEGATAPAESTTPTTPSTEPAAPKAGATANEAPEKYTLVVPDGISELEVKILEDEARLLGLSNEKTQALLNTRAGQIAQAAEGFLAELKADPVLGGARFEATIALAQKGRDVLAPPGSEEATFLADLFKTTGLHNHRLLVRMFHRAGQLTAEDLIGRQQGDGGIERTAAEILYDRTPAIK